jgi:plastocyanin
VESQPAGLMSAAAVVVLAAVVAGCGGGEAPSIPTEPQGTEPDKGSPGVNDASGGKVDIDIRARRFRPAVMRLDRGHIIVFTNDDDVPYTVRAVGGDLPRSGAIPPGGRFEYTALQAGRIRYRCVIHPGMTGELVVSR